MLMKKIFKGVSVLLVLILLFLAGALAALTIFEYRPKEIENAVGEQSHEVSIDPEKELTFLSWNTGYFALGEKSDFFMDGGKMVRGISKEDVFANLEAVSEGIKKEDADVIFLQEVDRPSYRSFHTDQVKAVAESLDKYNWSFANNFKCFFVPFPFPPIRDVDAGIMTLSKYRMSESCRVSLPVPFKWPVRVSNLKRCLIVSRVPVGDSGKDLVLINLHLEAYDDGEGKVAQTKALVKIFEEEIEKGNYVIAGGDFNQTFSEIDLKKYDTGREELWKPGIIETSGFRKMHFLMDDGVPTCRSLDKPLDRTDPSFGYYVIDGFIVSDNMKVTELKTLDYGFKNSDHNPVRLRVKIK